MTETRFHYNVPGQPQRSTWQDILKRLQGVSCKVASGAASVTLHILVEDGEPVHWFEPVVKRLEPKRAARQFVEGVKRDDDQGTD